MSLPRVDDTAFDPGLPASGRAFQPILWEVIDRWHNQEAELQDWDAVCRIITPRHEGWAGLAEHLQLINTFQWHQEDKSRDPAASDRMLAAVKRAIDSSNQRRVRTVEALDEWLLSRLQPNEIPASEAPLHSESPASIVDRLTVLALKIYHVRQVLTSERRRLLPEPLGEGSASEPKGLGDAQDGKDQRLLSLYGQLRSVTEQMVDLTECLDRLLVDIRERKVRVKLYRQIKIYRQSAEDAAAQPSGPRRPPRTS